MQNDRESRGQTQCRCGGNWCPWALVHGTRQALLCVGAFWQGSGIAPGGAGPPSLSLRPSKVFTGSQASLPHCRRTSASKGPWCRVTQKCHLGLYPRESKAGPEWCLATYVHSSPVPNSQSAEATQVSTDGRVGEGGVAHAPRGFYSASGGGALPYVPPRG